MPAHPSAPDGDRVGHQPATIRPSWSGGGTRLRRALLVQVATRTATHACYRRGWIPAQPADHQPVPGSRHRAHVNTDRFTGQRIRGARIHLDRATRRLRAWPDRRCARRFSTTTAATRGRACPGTCCRAPRRRYTHPTATPATAATKRDPTTAIHRSCDPPAAMCWSARKGYARGGCPTW